MLLLFRTVMIQTPMAQKDAANFWSDWDKIANFFRPIGDNPKTYANQMRISKKGWLIGPYCLLTEVAQALRWDEEKKSCVDPELLETLTNLGARYGARATDIAPGAIAKDGTPGYVTRGKMGERKNPQEISQEAKNGYNNRKRPGKPQQRDTDHYPHVAKYWRGRTLEAHHIVEKGILKVLGANSGKLNDDVAPCVLAFAELHRRLFTPFFARKDGDPNDVNEQSIREHFKGVSSGEEAYEELVKVYDRLYSRDEMRELLTFAEIISEELKDKGKLKKC